MPKKPNKKLKPKPGPKTPRRPAGTKDAEGLTYKQRQFVAYYLGKCNGNATEAARMAGYAKPAEQGHENLRKPHIRSAIDAKLAGAAMSADEVLARLSDMASADPADFLAITPKSVRIDLDKARRLGKTHLIRKVKSTKDGVEIELHDSQAALEKLGKYHGLFLERADDRRRESDPGDDARRTLEEKLARLLGPGDPPDPA